MPPRRTNAHRARAARRIGAVLAQALLLLLSLSAVPPTHTLLVQANADSPLANPTFVPLRNTVTNHSVCIAAGDDGPCFSLDELQSYAPVWRIRPPIWIEYPTFLDGVPLVARQYAPETVAYLAGHEVHYGDRESPYLALTFDCETRRNSTEQILQTLRQENVHATFFVLGKYAYLNPGIIRQMAADGHEIGSHSFFHPLFFDIPPLRMASEITYTEAAVSWAVGEYVPMRYFRFPYAGRNYATRSHVAALGYQSAFWDMDPRGWEPAKTAEDVVEYVRRTAHPGGIVIMHCGSWDDANALTGVIQAIRDRGFIPGMLSDVLTAEDRNVPGYQVLPP